MRIIEIAPLPNGAHKNQSYPGFIPDGWAVVCESDKCENFPFGSFEVEYIDGVPYMKEDSWTPGTLPEPEPEVEAVDTEAVIIETLIDQEIRIAELELMML